MGYHLHGGRTLHGRRCAGRRQGQGRGFDGCPNLSHPELVGGSEPRAHFLTERLDTVALYLDDKAEEKDRERSVAKHDWFVRLLRQASQDVPYLEVAAKLLTGADVLARIHVALKQAKARPTESAVIIMGGTNPLERDDWRDWWRGFRASLRSPTTHGKRMRCIVTGESIEPVATNPKIRGLAGVGGLSMGDVLAGFDKAAFQSYGLEQAANAAMSEATYGLCRNTEPAYCR